MKKERLKKVAIFDIDGTIFRSSLLIEVTEELIREGVFPQSIKNVYAKPRQDWIDRSGSYEKYIMAVVEVFDSNLININPNDFSRISKKVVDLHKNRVYRYTRDLVKMLKKKGYFLLAISHSPRELVYQFCKNWGFDKVYGRVYEIDGQGKFTGKTEFLKYLVTEVGYRGHQYFEQYLMGHGFFCQLF